MTAALRICVLAAAFALAACSRTQAPREVPVPVLPAGVIEMRVAHVINPRLPQMSAVQLQGLLDSIAQTTREHFGVQLRFLPPRQLSIAEVFALIPADRQREVMQQVYDFKSGRGDWNRLVSAYAAGLEQTGEPLADQIRFVQPHTGPIEQASFTALGSAVANLQVQRLRRWQSVKALDGGPAIDHQPYNEFQMWIGLGYADLPYDLVLTNQLIASIEYSYPAIHSAIRGGYANGMTTYSRSARFKAMAVWSSFAFLTEDAWVRELRGGDRYGAGEAARLSGTAAVHEIGHQLFHFGHPFGQRACVMNPVSMFAYRDWAQGLSAKDCPIGSNAAMTPGASRLFY